MAKKKHRAVKSNVTKPGFTLLWFIILLAVAVVAGACGSTDADLTLAPESELPDFV